jgi:serine/threonine-protein kinase HipA
MCQALGVGPTLKYQNEGGPSPEDIVSLLQTHSSRPDEDIRTFIDALALNWLIGGTDAHAKNYSLLHGARGALRLAPLYDVASILPYTDVDPKRVKLAMKIGGEYRMHAIGARQWRKLSVALRLDPNETLGRITALAARVAVEVVDVRRQLRRDGLRHAILDKLATVLVTRAHACAAELK